MSKVGSLVSLPLNREVKGFLSLLMPDLYLNDSFATLSFYNDSGFAEKSTFMMSEIKEIMSPAFVVHLLIPEREEKDCYDEGRMVKFPASSRFIGVTKDSDELTSMLESTYQNSDYSSGIVGVEEVYNDHLPQFYPGMSSIFTVAISKNGSRINTRNYEVDVYFIKPDNLLSIRIGSTVRNIYDNKIGIVLSVDDDNQNAEVKFKSGCTDDYVKNEEGEFVWVKNSITLPLVALEQMQQHVFVATETPGAYNDDPDPPFVCVGSTIEELQENSKRRFSYIDTYDFTRKDFSFKLSKVHYVSDYKNRYESPKSHEIEHFNIGFYLEASVVYGENRQYKSTHVFTISTVI
jgi:hypothetical protein